MTDARPEQLAHSWASLADDTWFDDVETSSIWVRGYRVERLTKADSLAADRQLEHHDQHW